MTSLAAPRLENRSGNISCSTALSSPRYRVAKPLVLSHSQSDHGPGGAAQCGVRPREVCPRRGVGGDEEDPVREASGEPVPE